MNENWIVEDQRGHFKAMSSPDGCEAVVTRKGSTVATFTGETAWMDAIREMNDREIAERIAKR